MSERERERAIKKALHSRYLSIPHIILEFFLLGATSSLRLEIQSSTTSALKVSAQKNRKAPRRQGKLAQLYFENKVKIVSYS